MARFILMILTPLILSSGPAYAEWVEVSEVGKYTAYVDPETIRRKENLVKMWGLDDYKTIETVAGKSYLSSKVLFEYECAEEQSRVLALHRYSEQMGNGALVYSNTNPGKWEHPIPGTVGQAEWNFACKKQ